MCALNPLDTYLLQNAHGNEHIGVHDVVQVDFPHCWGAITCNNNNSSCYNVDFVLS